MREALVHDLEQRAAQLTRRVLAETYADPFWQARYGDRGRQHVEQDGRFHLTYLMQALVTDDATIFAKYTRWLQTLLVSRGMCSAHIADNFERLERAIVDEIPNADPATDLLRAGRRALLYAEGPGRELQDLSADVARAVHDALRRDARGGAEAPIFAMDREAIDHCISYLADALASARPELFVSHSRWLGGYLEGRGASARRLEDLLEGLGRHLDLEPRVSRELAAAARPLLEQARREVAARTGALT